MNDTSKIKHLIDRVERMSAKMDAELAKSDQEWDRIFEIIVENGKLAARREIQCL